MIKNKKLFEAFAAYHTALRACASALRRIDEADSELAELCSNNEGWTLSMHLNHNDLSLRVSDMIDIANQILKDNNKPTL
jgi:hypothetical protein